MQRLALGVLAGLVILAAAARPARGATEARFPVAVDYESLRAALTRHLHNAGGEVWASADRCRTLALREASLEPAGSRLRITGHATVRAGLGFLGLCWAQVEWEGQAEIVAAPDLGPDWRLRLRDPEVRLLDPSGQPSGVVPRVWEAVRAWAETRLLPFTFDLGPAVADLRALLAAFADPARADAVAAVLRTLRPVGLAVEPEAVRVMLALDLPAAPPAARTAEPALSPAELRRWQARLESWDGFLVFVVKDLGGGESDPALRSELLDILLSARQELVGILGRGPEPGAPDPVRPLFLRTWDRLRSLLRRAATQRQDAGRGLRYATFLTAGDALAAVEAVAPSAGFELSADGLRRLARLLDPAGSGDPLEYSELPDAGLRQLFRFRDPDAPPRRPRRRAPGSFHWLGPRPAYADAEDLEWRDLGRRLDRWVPTAEELPAYRDTVARLLTLAADRALDPDQLEERFDDLYQHLVQATAWQESCWRQFVRRGGAVTYILSTTGDVGIMQINLRVWRGFFHPERLRWSAPYNAGAGAEILLHLLVRYGVREAGERLENAARSSYSAYNGGPARYRRYRQSRLAVDQAFWDKYRLVARGNAGEGVLCLSRRTPA